VLRYVWDRAEQIGPLGGLIQGVLERHPAAEETAAHPLAALPGRADPEEIARQLEALARELPAANDRPLSLVAAARLRERLAGLNDRAAWVADEAARKHLLSRAGQLLDRLGGGTP
jgi:MoxR-like ATPase